ncbi:MAG: lamin tail domain-containing protein [Spirochaetaceae bacterium]|nr:lamin tail domain-containing protein [Myxococcales bacterium]MCB9724363.1 lamin tail domain-containing protein [Spirochaetaceae bacterium]HPG27436.1 lamin tail domain-containing protein [Myxococcota bacterium]
MSTLSPVDEATPHGAASHALLGGGWVRRAAAVLLRPLRVASLILVSLGLGAGVAAATPISALVISEVMYEPIGADNGRQWVEIFNGTTSAVDLSQYELQWGRAGLSNSVALSGILAANSTWVVGGPTSGGTNGNPTYDQVVNFNPNLGDGSHPWAEDGLALVETSTSTLMHIVVYGGNGGGFSFFVDEQGNPAPIFDDSALAPGQSLEFTSTGWTIQATATPGLEHASLTVVPEPSTAVLMGLGLVGLGAIGRQPRLRRRVHSLIAGAH